MNELEQAKSDLAAARAAQVLLGKYGLDQNKFSDLVDTIQAKIKELKTPPDPFREAKRTIARQRAGERYNSNQVDYAIFLEDEVERLKAELAKAATIEPEFRIIGKESE